MAILYGPNGQRVDTSLGGDDGTAAAFYANQGYTSQAPGTSLASPGGRAPMTESQKKMFADNPFDANSSDPTERAQAQEWMNSKRSQAIHMAGAPTSPAFESLLNKDKTIQEAFRLKPGQINYTPERSGLNEMASKALAKGPSAWANLMLENQKADEAQQLSQARGQNAGNAATAESNLAMRGGLSSGARERLAKSSATSGNQMAQNITGSGAASRLGIQTQDEANKNALLGQLTSGQLAAGNQDIGTQQYNIGQNTQAQQYNIGNALNDVLQKRAYDVNAYNQGMKAWAADKTANAQGGGGKK